MSEQGCSCKVGSATDRYGLDRLDDELEARHAAGASLRELAAYVNKRVLEAALHGAGVEVSDVAFGAVAPEDAIDAVYEALAGTDSPAEIGARVRSRVRQEGVDVDAVCADWVTHPTVRSHLRECLDVETARDGTLTVEDGRDTIEWAWARCEGIVEQTFARLDSQDEVHTGDLDVVVSVRVTCRECDNSYRPDHLLEAGACDCPASDS